MELDDQMISSTCFHNMFLFRNSREFLGIPTNSVFMQFRNSRAELNDQLSVQRASISLHVRIPEFPGIPGNSYQCRFYVIPEFPSGIEWPNDLFNVLQYHYMFVFRNSREFLGIPTNAAFMQFRNSRVELNDQLSVQRAWISLHVRIPEFPWIPGNSYRFRFYVIPEFPSGIEWPITCSTCFNIITCSYSGIPGNSWEFLPIPLLCDSGIPE